MFSGANLHSPASVKKRGVFTGISKKLKWQEHGCYIRFRRAVPDHSRFSVWNELDVSRGICPTKKENRVLKDLINKLEHYQENNLIIMGDFNGNVLVTCPCIAIYLGCVNAAVTRVWERHRIGN